MTRTSSLGWIILCLSCVGIWGSPTRVQAQYRKAVRPGIVQHELMFSRQPLGELGSIQRQRIPGLAGYSQPVEISVPSGATIAHAEGTGFSTPQLDRTLIGIQVGYVYRLEVRQIPNHTNLAIYPTIELLDRLHPPAGKETRFPVPIEIASEDLELAIRGKFVTRVIYVEDPRSALPARQVPKQNYFEVMAHEDPLHVADELGRPIAILRIGSLSPDAADITSDFLFGSPPVVQHPTPAAVNYTPGPLDPRDLPQPRRTDPVPSVPELPEPPAVEPRVTSPADMPETTEPAPEDLPANESSPSDAPDDDPFDDEIQ